jgi:osmotically-inducible protein OsmY
VEYVIFGWGVFVLLIVIAVLLVRFVPYRQNKRERPDPQIAEDIEDRLQHTADVDATGIAVYVEQGAVTLSGTVTREGDRAIAVGVAESILGVIAVRDQLQVERRA